MVDSNKDNDDYQFVDLDTVNSDSVDTVQSFDGNSKDTLSKKIKSIQLDTRKKALIVVMVLIFSVIIYKSMGSSPNKKQMAETGVSVVKEPVKAVMVPQPIQSSQPAFTTKNSNINEAEIEKKLFQMKQNQETIYSNVSAISNQITVINANMANLESKIEGLSQVIMQISEKIKAHEMEQAKVQQMMKSRPKSSAPIARKASKTLLRYYIQAVIPGRAWLIATNGSTLTVSEGTMISGYGTVKLIDPRQGRVLTSSGQVIRFSPEDS